MHFAGNKKTLTGAGNGGSGLLDAYEAAKTAGGR
jgi:hypothetical protein